MLKRSKSKEGQVSGGSQTQQIIPNQIITDKATGEGL